MCFVDVGEFYLGVEEGNSVVRGNIFLTAEAEERWSGKFMHVKSEGMSLT